MKERRLALSPVEQQAASEGIISSFTALSSRLRSGLTIAGYVPMRGEADLMPLMHDVLRQGFNLALPVVVAKDQPLIFRYWDGVAPLCPGPYGTLHPADNAPQVQPDLLLIPLLAFDHAGYRLGYGGGFYDRTLELRRTDPLFSPVAAIGVGYACQQVADVPRLGHDQPLDGILTEQSFLFLADWEKQNTLAPFLSKRCEP